MTYFGYSQADFGHNLQLGQFGMVLSDQADYGQLCPPLMSYMP